MKQRIRSGEQRNGRLDFAFYKACRGRVPNRLGLADAIKDHQDKLSKRPQRIFSFRTVNL
ncbi:hypothetical protein PO124_20380 [Bacillus licheniformis]|nr:hypothetical protein [Bacillus licheniformis]